MANRPPSSGTRGRSSGGKIGITSRIIHSGRLPERRNASTSLSRLAAFCRRMIEVSVRMIMRSSAAISSRSSLSSRLRIASAPIWASKASPKSSLALRYSSSVRTWCSSQLGVTGVADDVGLEVEDPLELAHGHVEQQADARRQSLEEPDVGDRRRQLDVAHALAPDLGLGNLDPALVAHHAAVLHPLVLAAQALPVGDRAEDLGAEQAVALGLEGAVVDGLRLGDLAVRPRADLLGARQAQTDGVEVVEGVFGFSKKLRTSLRVDRSMLPPPTSSSCCRRSTVEGQAIGVPSPAP